MARAYGINQHNNRVHLFFFVMCTENAIVIVVYFRYRILYNILDSTLFALCHPILQISAACIH